MVILDQMNQSLLNTYRGMQLYVNIFSKVNVNFKMSTDGLVSKYFDYILRLLVMSKFDKKLWLEFTDMN